MQKQQELTGYSRPVDSMEGWGKIQAHREGLIDLNTRSHGPIGLLTRRGMGAGATGFAGFIGDRMRFAKRCR